MFIATQWPTMVSDKRLYEMIYAVKVNSLAFIAQCLDSKFICVVKRVLQNIDFNSFYGFLRITGCSLVQKWK